MKILTESYILFQYMFHIQCLFNTDENPFRSIPPIPMHVSYLNLKTYEHPLEASLLYQCMFLFNPYSKLMTILSETYRLFQYIFLTQPLFKIDEKPL